MRRQKDKETAEEDTVMIDNDPLLMSKDLDTLITDLTKWDQTRS